MKKQILLAAVALALGAWLIAQNAATPKPLADLTPAGAVLYLEARNFGALLGDWNTSGEKKTWLASPNHQVFSRSRLYLRLEQVFQEYTNAIGLPPDMTLLNSVAGGETALAIYDINNLEFLYITRLPSARAMQSVLWNARTKFTARTAAGTAYYLKSDGKRTALFAIAGDLLLVATREDALTGALALISGGTPPTVRSEEWFQQATAAGAAGGELRMLLNMDKLLRASAFRTYWIQANRSDLAPFRAGINVLNRTATEVNEQRVLLRAEPTTAPDASSTGALLALAQNAGLYRVWAQPEATFARDLITQKILLPGPSLAVPSRTAPTASIEALQLGTSSDLETRLDGAPFDPPGPVYKAEAIQALLDANKPQALLLLQSSRETPDRVFVSNDSVVAMQSAVNWDAAQVRNALRGAVEGLYTTSGLGVGWRERRAGNDAIQEMDGLARIAFAIRGRTLLIADNAAYLQPVLAANGAAGANVAYAAGYRTAAELPNYTRIMRLIEAPQVNNGDPNEPPFFSSNLSSLARTLQRAQSVAITAQDDGRQLKQSTIYRLTR
ncbi:MAG: hypothetical protein U0R19_01680 [Bryobacteraceae bacterium]